MAKSKKKSTQNVENIGGQVIQAGGNVTVNEKSSKSVDDVQPLGFYSVPWNGKDNSGRKAASGVYFYRLETKRFAKIKKMVLIQ